MFGNSLLSAKRSNSFSIYLVVASVWDSHIFYYFINISDDHLNGVLRYYQHNYNEFDNNNFNHKEVFELTNNVIIQRVRIEFLFFVVFFSAVQKFQKFDVIIFESE